MPKRLICSECAEPLDPREIRVVIPEDCDVDVACYGNFHRDCGIFHELGEDGLLFEQNVVRLFAMFQSVLTDWSDPESVTEYMLQQINSEVLKLNREFYGSDLQDLNRRQPICRHYGVRED